MTEKDYNIKAEIDFIIAELTFQNSEFGNSGKLKVDHIIKKLENIQKKTSE